MSPSLFLELPAELRNNIYEKVLEDHPVARLARNRKFRDLIVGCPLASVNKQIRREFVGFAKAFSPFIETTVRNFDFSHIVTFLNRLSEPQLAELHSTPTSAEPVRHFCIILYFDPTFESSNRIDLTMHRRWLQRLEHPTKKGAQINFEYEVKLIDCGYVSSRNSCNLQTARHCVKRRGDRSLGHALRDIWKESLKKRPAAAKVKPVRTRRKIRIGGP